MRPFVVLFLLAAAFGTPAAAQETRRLDASLEALLRSRVRVQAAPPSLGVASADAAEAFPFGLAVESGGPGEPARVGVFVRFASAAALDELTAAGAVVGTVTGDMASASVPVDALAALGRSPSFLSIEAARVVLAEHDSSMAAIDVDQLRTVVAGQFVGATGEGAIVAIYDTGLDVTHPDFIDVNGQTRVLGLWDQTNITNSPPPGFSRGFYCTRAAVQQRIAGAVAACPQQDFQAHGTHVAGSAAGDGSAGDTPFRYAGVAPNADLMIVKGGPGAFFENLIIDGLNWLKSEALRLGRPMVVNLSLGGQFGPHDGSRIYEQMIDNLSGAGFIVVVSAGNQGSNENTTGNPFTQLLHARGTAAGVAPQEFELVLSSYTPNPTRCAANFVALDFWYEAADRLRIEVIRPNGAVTGANTGEVVAVDNPDGHVEIDNASGGVDPNNGDREALIFIDDCGASGAAPRAGSWTIRVTPTQTGSGAPYDMWTYSQQLGFDGNARGGAGFDNQFIVGSPGNARRAVTVGAFVTRLCWPSLASANICYTEQEAIGDLARFSSGGPRRDGVLKPEIAAPGLGVASARSASASIPNSRVLPDGVHMVIEGTSMAAPHVTGAVAVLFGVRPGLTPEELKQVLQTSAVADAFTTRTYGVTDPDASPAHWWGFGKLNVRNALIQLAGNAPAILALESSSAIPDTTTLGAAGTRLPLLRLSLAAQGFEPIRVVGLTFDVEGEDPGARLLLVDDVNANGVPEPDEPVLGAAPVPLDGDVSRVEVAPPALVVPEFSQRQLLVALELSGAAPNGTDFEATFVADATRSIGTSTQVENSIVVVTEPVSSGVASTTVLGANERVSFSSNPVRGEDVVFNFIEAPTTAAIFTVTGRRIADLVRRVGSGELNVVWDLTNDDGSRVAPGVYLLVFSVQGELFREKLFVLTPGADLPAALELR
jgi:subtilisin family serine protease